MAFTNKYSNGIVLLRSVNLSSLNLSSRFLTSHFFFLYSSLLFLLLFLSLSLPPQHYVTHYLSYITVSASISSTHCSYLRPVSECNPTKYRIPIIIFITCQERNRFFTTWGGRGPKSERGSNLYSVFCFPNLKGCFKRNRNLILKSAETKYALFSPCNNSGEIILIINYTFQLT